MSTIKILFFVILLIFLINPISAVVVYGEWEDNKAQSIEIENKNSVDFSAYFGTIYPPMTISIKLYSGNNLIHSFVDSSVNQKSFSKTYTINKDIYSAPGNFQIKIKGSDKFGEMSDTLYLNVFNNPPAITSSPITEINEGEYYSYQVTATDADGDVLTYSLTQNPDWISIDTNTGFISGTAPLLDSDYEYAITVKVSDGADFVTQFFTLLVRNAVTPPENHPPAITSSPITEINEGEYYSYQVTATDADGDVLTYSLTQNPEWISINSQTGLITGTAPEVNENCDYSVNVKVSDGTDADTQSYILTVKYVPNPSLSQTVELVEDVNIEYSSVISELESVILEVYYKKIGSDNYGTVPIATREIKSSSYSEIFDFYDIHGITKGDYLFVIKNSVYNLEETDEITVPDYSPEVDLSSISEDEKNFNEEGLTEINLPVPEDKNPEDAPVKYISATSLDGKTDILLDTEIYLLTVTGNQDETGDYQIELEFGNSEGEKESGIFEGEIYELIDISGVLENNEDDTGVQGVIRVYSKNSGDYLPLEIDRINDGEGSIIDAESGKIQTDSEGKFNFQINKKTSESDEIILQARIGTPENYTGYVRTIELSGEDNSDVLVRAVPYSPYENEPEDFRQFMNELAGGQPNTRFDFDGKYLRGINEQFENYTGLIGIEILSVNPFGEEYGTFTLEQQEGIKNKILDPGDISGIIGDYIITEEQVYILSESQTGHYSLYNSPVTPKEEVIPEMGWIIVVPYSNMEQTGLAYTYHAGRTLVYKGAIYLKPFIRINSSITSHEFGHMFIGSGHPVTLADQTIMSLRALGLVTTGPADKKAGKLIYEKTYMTFPTVLFPRVDYLSNILGLGFYGENQETETISEYPFEIEEHEDNLEEDCIKEREDSNSNSKLRNSKKTYSSNSEYFIVLNSNESINDNNANAPLYGEKIFLKPKVNKSNIIGSLLDILKRMISFIFI